MRRPVDLLFVRRLRAHRPWSNALIRFPKRTLGAVLVVGAAVALGFGACTLPTHGTGPEPERCQEDATCTQCIPCCVGKCNSGTCEYGPIQGDPVQTPGDCQHVTCDGLNPILSPDPADAPDDGNSCTDDVCQDGAVQHNPKPDGVVCSVGTAHGTCSAGMCKVTCGNNMPCDDGNPCTDDSCDLNTFACSFVKLDGIPIPGVVDTPGDCVAPRCVAGVANPTFPDPNDTHDDGLVCTADTCDNGTPVNTDLPSGTSCGTTGSNLVCNGKGACVGCVGDSMCPDPGDCKQRHCDSNGQCTPQALPLGTPSQFQVTGDCHILECDGAGNPSVNAVDQTDVPNDGQFCTQDSCDPSGNQIHTPLTGTACETNGVCTVNGTCCHPTTCATLGYMCGPAPDGCGMMLNCGSCTDQGAASCGTNGTCTGNTCAYYGAGTLCLPASCVDGPSSSTATTASTCNGTGSCVPGMMVSCGRFKCNSGHTACLATCTSANDCTPGSYCNSMGKCAALKTNGTMCLAGSECQSTFCVEGVCCNSACSSDMTTLCMTCLKTKGATQDGTCGQAAANYDPYDLCGSGNTKCCTGSAGQCCTGAGNCSSCLE